MIWHLIAAIFAGLGAAGVGLLLRVVSGRRLPRWIVPVCAGLGMLAYQIHHEYSWFNHKQHQLPAAAQVISSEQDSVFWRPWTYLFPMTTAFSVIDQGNMISRQVDGQHLVEFMLYRFERHHMDLVTHRPYLMNCATHESLPLEGEQRQPRFHEMRRVDDSDPVYQAVCAET
ncbi:MULTISPECIES: hypothetical protein [Halomonadaceae]|uniref:hypothetical protein n=1 Tax=Halomonadaceae TaxID=28256 RepID=UPI00159AA41C|nr:MULTISPECIES: hypothetical protein [Halomonas]QJQ96791.1 hypothetical protein HIO72_16885 [Halomonas sp. PA5]